MPTYPDAAFGFDVVLAPIEAIYLKIGLFDGSALDGAPTGSTGPNSFFDATSERFLIGEAGVHWILASRSLPGRLAVGAWRHDGDFARFDGGSEDGTDGLYAVLDQRVWARSPTAADDPRGIGCFAQVGSADADVSTIDWHLGGGAVWRGPFEDRRDDALGLGASRVHFSDRAPGHDESAETVFELFYRYQVTPWFALKPDVEYVVDPGGDSRIDNAVVLTLRARIDF